jgi:hypothetical protein
MNFWFRQPHAEQAVTKLGSYFKRSEVPEMEVRFSCFLREFFVYRGFGEFKVALG